MSIETCNDLASVNSFAPILYTASVGSAWSGTMRGLLTVHRFNGSSSVVGECSSPGQAADIAKALNERLELGTPAKIRNARAREEIAHLLDLVATLEGRDNRENAKTKLKSLRGLFLDEPASLSEEREAAVLVTR